MFWVFRSLPRTERVPVVQSLTVTGPILGPPEVGPIHELGDETTSKRHTSGTDVTGRRKGNEVYIPIFGFPSHTSHLVMSVRRL